MNNNLIKIAKKIAGSFDDYEDEFIPDEIMPQGYLQNKFYDEFDNLYDYFNRRHKKMSKIHEECSKKLEELKKKLPELEQSLRFFSSNNNYDPQAVARTEEAISQLNYKISRYEDLNRHFEWVLGNINNAYGQLHEIKSYE